jgi:hypothetical protein
MRADACFGEALPWTLALPKAEICPCDLSGLKGMTLCKALALRNKKEHKINFLVNIV